MRTIASAVVVLLTLAIPALAQRNWFQPAVLTNANELGEFLVGPPGVA